MGKNKKVLDVGSRKGVTACFLAENYNCEVIGIDASKKMLEHAKELAKKKGLGEKVNFIVADAHNLPFKDGSFDIVIAECTTALLDKEKIFHEFIRVLKPGGYIGDLEMMWKKESPKKLVEKIYVLWEGFETMGTEEWGNFLEKLGLIDIKAVDFTNEIPSMERFYLKELGIKGMVKMVFNLLKSPDL